MSEDEARLFDPGFTPSVKAIPSLVDRVARGAPDVSRAAAKALLRVQGPIVARVHAAMEALSPREKKPIVVALGARAGKGEDDALFELCSGLLLDEDAAPCRTAAARVLAKIGGAKAEAAIASALERSTAPAERAALLSAIGKIGGETARAMLDTETSDDARVVRARLIAHRTDVRGREPSSILAGVTPRLDVVLTCRRGLEDVVAEELDTVLSPPAPPSIEPERLGVTWDRPLDAITKLRTTLRVGLSSSRRRGEGETVAESVARTIGAPSVADELRRFTRGPVRFRLAWQDGQKHRADTWAVASAVHELAQDLVNDPTDAAWEIVATVENRFVHVDLFPRLTDTRFAYRAGDVPAASHPTIAAALVRVAGARDDDVVWDPFVGSGLELCERSLLGPYRSLVGTDTDGRALSVARENLRACGAEDFALVREPAVATRIAGLTCVITNPPMGRRVLASSDLERVVGDVIAHAATMLVPGGRVVLLSPRPRHTREVAERCGLVRTLDTSVDLGGFDAVLQRFDAPAANARLRTREAEPRSRTASRPSSPPRERNEGARRSPRRRG